MDRVLCWWRWGEVFPPDRHGTTARHSPVAILDLNSPLLPYSFLIPRPLPLAGRSLAALFLNPTRKGTWVSVGGGRPVCTTWYLLVE
jgi:hypothetical protein